MRSAESKAERFERIAERRVNETLRSLRLLGNLADRRNYAYSDEQVNAMIAAIDSEFRSLRLRFKSELEPGDKPFRFNRRGP
jgi:hypothetical protein